jgi:hypothetical protein
MVGKITRHGFKEIIRNLLIVPSRKTNKILKLLINRRKEKYLFSKQYKFFVNKEKRFDEFSMKPMLNQKYQPSGFDRHYFYHPSWASRVLAEEKPDKHVDISSVLRFAGDLSAFIPVDYYEYNVPDIKLTNLTVNKADLLHLPFENDSVTSLSCMHVIEHVGLGRYGDPLDIDGDIKAIAELKRVLAIGGSLLFVVPVSGRPRLEFNAHRIYSYEMVVNMFEELNLKEFALIPDSPKHGGLIRNADFKLCKSQNYACGCFHFIK